MKTRAPNPMGADKRRFHQLLGVCVVLMFVAPLAIHASARMAGMDSPLTSFMSLFLVLGSMGAMCKLVVDREEEEKSKRGRRIKDK